MTTNTRTHNPLTTSLDGVDRVSTTVEFRLSLADLAVHLINIRRSDIDEMGADPNKIAKWFAKDYPNVRAVMSDVKRSLKDDGALTPHAFITSSDYSMQIDALSFWLDDLWRRDG